MNASTASAVSRLESIVGSNAFSADSPELANYAVDGLAPTAIARPRTAEQVAEIVRFAKAEDLTIIPSGARTKVAMGALPQRYNIALDLSGLSRVIAYDPADLTLSVEPGATLSGLAQALGKHGQFLPLGAPFAARATIAGTVVSGVDGPMRQFYGTARDFLLGAEFVTGDGVAGKSGGRVVKNVTGYDLHKPLIGSLGTLAIVTKLNFRTFPAPQEMRGFLVYFPNADSAAALRHAVAKSFLRPLTLEILGSGAASLLASATASAIEPTPLPDGLLAHKGWILATSFAGDEAVLARCERDLRQLADFAGGTAFHTIGAGQDHAALAAVFGRIREFIPIALESSAATTILKVSVPPARLDHALCSLKHSADEHSLFLAVLARGVAVAHAALLPTERNESALHRVISATKRISTDIAQLGGHSTIPWCPVEWKAHINIWGEQSDSLPVMRKLKSVFDPRSILAPGRFVGGI